MKIYPYSMASASAKALAEALGVKRIKKEGAPLDYDGHIINWGASNIKREINPDASIINPPCRVALAANKLKAFRAFEKHGKGVVAVPFTESLDEANKWLAEGFDVVQRDKLNGHSGEGITIWKAEATPCIEDDEPAPLYTKLIKKDQEYRIHVGNNGIIFQQRKARKKDIPDEQVNWEIRNHGNGFIFANNGIDAGKDVCENAIAAVAALGLDFGAVDICTEKGTGKSFVLEVNTAPGLMGKTLDAYVNFFKTYEV